tara:strand:- start:238 stop:408 length:171 start_codon:yes stop_codon:yes gene_type:complete
MISEIGEYRALAGKSVISNPDNLIKAIRQQSPDEAVAAIEIICNRIIKKYGTKETS